MIPGDENAYCYVYKAELASARSKLKFGLGSLRSHVDNTKTRRCSWFISCGCTSTRRCFSPGFLWRQFIGEECSIRFTSTCVLLCTSRNAGRVNWRILQGTRQVDIWIRSASSISRVELFCRRQWDGGKKLWKVLKGFLFLRYGHRRRVKKIRNLIRSSTPLQRGFSKRFRCF